MPISGRGHERPQLHAGDGRYEIDQKERKCGDEPQKQKIAEGIGAKARGELAGERPGAANQILPARTPRHQKDHGGSGGRANDARGAADQRAEQDAARDREKQGARNRKRHHHDVDRDEGAKRSDHVVVHEGVDRHAMPHQGLEREMTMGAAGKDHHHREEHHGDGSEAAQATARATFSASSSFDGHRARVLCVLGQELYTRALTNQNSHRHLTLRRAALAAA